jgi:hypothetical protein
MRIKIIKNKKNLNERIGLTSQMSSRFILDNILNPNEQTSIFNKKLIFYDLETMGLLPSPYVHQIAAIEYDLETVLKKIATGRSLGKTQIVAPKPSGGCIIKNEFDLEKFKDKNKKIIFSRRNFYNNFKDSFSKSDNSYTRISNSMIDTLGSDNGVNLNMSRAGIGVAIMANCLYSKSEADKFYLLLNNHLNAIKNENIELTSPLKLKKEQTSKEKFIALMESTNVQTITISSFLSSLFEFVNTIVSSPYSFLSGGSATMIKLKKEDPARHKTLMRYYRNQANLKKMTINFLKKEFDLTWAENRAFTHYEDFPLAEYYEFVKTSERKEAKQIAFKRIVKGKQKLVKHGLPTEKEGLEMFLKYLQDLGNDNYILIGHNIKTFDNNVILARCQENEIDEKLILDFQDSYVFDTLDLMKIYTKQLVFMNNLCESGIAEKLSSRKTAPKRAEKTKDSIMKAKELHDTLKDEYPSVKAKLDGIMRLYESTKDLEQSHTADDDCKQLANALIPSIVQMTKMIKDYGEVLDLIDDKETPPPSSFSDLPTSRSKVASSAVSKIKSDLLYNPDFIASNLLPGFNLSMKDIDITPKDFSGSPDEYKSIKATKNNFQKSIDDIVKQFYYYLVKILFEDTKSLTDSQVQTIMTLRRAEVGEYFKKWSSTEATSNDTVKNAIDHIKAFADAKAGSEIRRMSRKKWSAPKNPLETKPQEDDPLNMSESIINKWSRMIK